MPYTAKPDSVPQASPHRSPSTVLWGLMCGDSLCFPKRRPPNSANVSLTMAGTMLFRNTAAQIASFTEMYTIRSSGDTG